MVIPKTLGKEGSRWYKQVAESFDFEAHELETLYQAASCLDRIQSAIEAIDSQGIMIPDRYGVLKQNPAVMIERDNRVLFARLNRELNLYAGNTIDNRLPRKL